MRKFFITIDYELFGDGSGDVFQHIIRPTDRILNLCERYGAQVTIFFEVVEYWRLKEEWDKGNRMGYSQNPIEAIENQLRNALKNGHDVQLHLHPAWVGAEWKDGRWYVDNENWGVARYVSRNNVTLRDLFVRGKQTLEDLFKPVSEGYNCSAFRAGGYNIHPCKSVIDELNYSGFRIDSSVFNGGYANNSRYCYDFSSVPNNLGWWMIDDDVCVPSAKKNSLYELPILAVDIPNWKKYLRFSVLWRAFVHLKKTRDILLAKPIYDQGVITQKKRGRGGIFGRQYQNWDFTVVSSSTNKVFL